MDGAIQDKNCYASGIGFKLGLPSCAKPSRIPRQRIHKITRKDALLSGGQNS